MSTPLAVLLSFTFGFSSTPRSGVDPATGQCRPGQPTTVDECPVGAALPYPPEALPLPGDISSAIAETHVGYHVVEVQPPTQFHGAAVYAGWTSTNGFVRHYLISYGRLSVKGEPKHGLWRWTLPGATAATPRMWWCHLGGAFHDGLGDGAEDNMDAIWREVGASSRAGELGPLAEAAGLRSIMVTCVRVHLNAEFGARVWVNVGGYGSPEWRARDPSGFEVYIVRAYYDELPSFADADDNFGGFWSPIGTGAVTSKPCPSDGSSNLDRNADPDPNPNPFSSQNSSGERCSGLHTFVFLVTDAATTEHTIGLPSSGLHYGPMGSAYPCPSRCGVGACDCDGVLVDASFDGTLEEKWTSEHLFMPVWRGQSTP